MGNLFDDADRAPILERLGRLRPDAARQWGKMTPAQMLTHCYRAMEVPAGERVEKRMLLGYVLGPLMRGLALGDRPFMRGAPTAPFLVIADQRELDAERTRLLELIDRFCRAGPRSAGRHPHVFFGRLSGEEWGRLMHKHLDHHLSQFGL